MHTVQRIQVTMVLDDRDDCHCKAEPGDELTVDGKQIDLLSCAALPGCLRQSASTHDPGYQIKSCNTLYLRHPHHTTTLILLPGIIDSQINPKLTDAGTRLSRLEKSQSMTFKFSSLAISWFLSTG